MMNFYNQIHQRLQQRNINTRVFMGASGIIVAILVFAVLAPKWADATFKHLQSMIVDNASWYYILTVAINFIDHCLFGNFALWQYQIRLRPFQTRIQQFFMVCYAVFGRHGDWFDVFWCG